MGDIEVYGEGHDVQFLIGHYSSVAYPVLYERKVTYTSIR